MQYKMSFFMYSPSIQQKGKKVKSMTFVDDTLVTGDSIGNLLLYYDMATRNSTNNQDQKKQINSKGIKKIACLHEFKVLIVLTEDQVLSMIDFPSFQIKQKIADNIENFVVHPKLDEIYVARKQNLYFYKRFQDKMKKISDRDINLIYPPIIFQWGGGLQGNILFLGNQKQYSIIQLDKQFAPQPVKAEPAYLPYLKVSSQQKNLQNFSWYIYIHNNLVVKLNKVETGEFSPIQLPKMSIVVGIEETSIYLIIVTTLKVNKIY